jgi:hypothetical protein
MPWDKPMRSVFIRQFDNGSGDYTQERHQWLDQLTMDEILTDIKQRQKISD